MAEAHPTPENVTPQAPPGKWAKYARVKRAKRLAAGLCGTCGREPIVPGKTTCAVCLKKGSERNARVRPLIGPARNEAARDQRKARAAAGLCTDCGKSPPAHKSKRCLECLIRSRAKGQRLRTTRKKPSAEWMQAYKREWRAKRKASGVCTTCGGERDVPGRVRCADCHTKDGATSRVKRRSKGDKLNEPLRAKRKQWEADGKCNWCGGERDRTDRKRCAACRGKYKATLRSIARKRRALGLCPGCGNVPENGVRCQKCLEYARTAYRKYAAADPVQYRSRSHRRRLRIINGGKYTQAEWEAIKKAQDYRCLRCGKREPEITLHTDHVFPLVKGGRNTADNLQGLCEHCNKSKGAKHIDYRTPENNPYVGLKV